VSGSGISWAICKSAPRSRQITIPAPTTLSFTGRMPFLPPNQQRQSTKGIGYSDAKFRSRLASMSHKWHFCRHDSLWQYSGNSKASNFTAVISNNLHTNTGWLLSKKTKTNKCVSPQTVQLIQMLAKIRDSALVHASNVRFSLLQWHTSASAAARH